MNIHMSVLISVVNHTSFDDVKGLDECSALGMVVLLFSYSNKTKA